MQAHSAPNSVAAQTQEITQNTSSQTPQAPVAAPLPDAKALELKPTAIVPKTPLDGSVRKSLALSLIHI